MMLDDLNQIGPSQVLIDLAPALNALHSFATVADADNSPGISEWSQQIRSTLSEGDWLKHQLIAHWIGIGILSNIVEHQWLLGEFPDFLAILSAFEAETLRDDLLYWMVARPGNRLIYKSVREISDPLSLLESWDSFKAFYDHPEMDAKKLEIARHLYEYLLSPTDLRILLTEYLKYFWDVYLNDEWLQNIPRLNEALKRFAKMDFAGMSHFEVIETVTRRNLRGSYRPDILREYDILRFVPSPHCGPYVMRTSVGRELRIAFGVERLTELARGGEGLDSAHVVDQIKALADETRLDIIRILKSEGEMGTPDIIERLKLSKSAASRHLRQLYATGIVDTRVDDDGLSKYYRLNPNAVDRMQGLLEDLLG